MNVDDVFDSQGDPVRDTIVPVDPSVLQDTAPATSRDPVSAVRLADELTAAVDKWAEDHEETRSEGIRRLVELGLRAKGK